MSMQNNNNNSTTNRNPLSEPLTLPCGAVLKNRIVKSCMSDSLGDGRGRPTPTQIRLYERWQEGQVALSCIGEVQFDHRYPEKPGNLLISTGTTCTDAEQDDSKAAAHLFRELAARASAHGAHIWPQLGHAGALTHLPINPKPKGPSELKMEVLNCEAMTRQDIMETLPNQYATAARQAKSWGFTGVMIHAGHGFLLSQFLSPLFNHRTDEYGGDVRGRSRIILSIVHHVRDAVGQAFPVGIRINSSDLLEGGLTEADAADFVSLLDKTSIDLIDISGGTYFPGAKAASESSSGNLGPLFLNFAQEAKKRTTKPIVLTGGFKKREQAVSAVARGATDMVGVARGLALNPNLAKEWLKPVIPIAADDAPPPSRPPVDPTFPRFESTIPGGVTAWYTMKLTALGEDSEDDFKMDLPTAVQLYEARDAQRTQQWVEAFGK